MTELWQWLEGLQWDRLVPELLGKAGGVLAGFAISWFVLVRKRLRALERAQAGDSDDFIFQSHHLLPAGGDDVALVFRNVAPKTTLNELYDNIAVRRRVRELADACTLSDPILQTTGTLGFELLNDAAGHIAGLLAIAATPRQTWLFAMTCEDRQLVRKKCIRCFLIRPEDLRRFEDWKWCTSRVQIEKPWHWFRIVALHRIAKLYAAQNGAHIANDKGDHMPIVHDQDRHDRIMAMSVGIHQDEALVGPPHRVDWSDRITTLRRMGLDLPIQDLPNPDLPIPVQSAIDEESAESNSRLDLSNASSRSSST